MYFGVGPEWFDSPLQNQYFFLFTQWNSLKNGVVWKAVVRHIAVWSNHETSHKIKFSFRYFEKMIVLSRCCYETGTLVQHVGWCVGGWVMASREAMVDDTYFKRTKPQLMTSCWHYGKINRQIALWLVSASRPAKLQSGCSIKSTVFSQRELFQRKLHTWTPLLPSRKNINRTRSTTSICSFSCPRVMTSWDRYSSALQFSFS